MKRRQMMSEVNATHTKNTEKACWGERGQGNDDQQNDGKSLGLAD